MLPIYMLIESLAQKADWWVQFWVFIFPNTSAHDNESLGTSAAGLNGFSQKPLMDQVSLHTETFLLDFTFFTDPFYLSILES